VIVTVFGAGYVGLTTATVLASKHEVIVVDINQEKVALINQGKPPIKEDDLEFRLRQAVESRRLKAVGTDYEFGPQNAVLICVDTPSNPDGSVNLTSVESVVDSISRNYHKLLDDYLLIAVRSTVPPGTTRSLVLNRMQRDRNPDKFGVVFQPEFLRQGKAIYDLLNPDRLIVGASDARAFDMYKALTVPCLDKSNMNVLQMSIESAEMCKYVSNSFLATKISFVNEMASLAERIPNADIDDVVRGMTADHRICPSHLRPGLGYGGSCLPKDVNGFISFGKRLGISMHLLDAVHVVNEKTTDRLLALLGSDIAGLVGQKVAVLGLAFKAGTDDTRESPSLSLIERLSQLGAEIHAHDPTVNPEQTKNAFSCRFEVCDEVESCTKGAHALFLMTEWNEYLEMGLDQITSTMTHKLVIDGRRLFVHASIPDDVLYRPLGSYTQVT
jgi:UDPglucose 6-dehydrogenase